MEWSGCPLTGPLFFVDKTPDCTHQMGHGDINTTFPENLCDPVDADQSPFTNHFSAFHFSRFTNPLPLSLLTNHFSPLTAALAAQRCASRISSLYSLNASILGCLR